MQIDLSIVPIGVRAREIVETAREAERLGFDGISTWDELCDVTGGDTWSLEAWTLLSAVAAVTDRVAIGPLVLNVANRDAGTFAVAAATLQDLSGGRLWIGLGAGTGGDSPFCADQHALGRPPAAASQRRANLERHITEIRAVWSGAKSAFLTPKPAPPLVVGAFGPKTAELAGRVADGIAVPVAAFGDTGMSMEDLVAIARASHQACRRTSQLKVFAHYGWGDDIADPKWHRGAEIYDRLAALDVERLIIEAPAAPDRLRSAAKKLPLGRSY